MTEYKTAEANQRDVGIDGQTPKWNTLKLNFSIHHFFCSEEKAAMNQSNKSFDDHKWKARSRLFAKLSGSHRRKYTEISVVYEQNFINA